MGTSPIHQEIFDLMAQVKSKLDHERSNCSGSTRSSRSYESAASYQKHDNSQTFVDLEREAKKLEMAMQDRDISTSQKKLSAVKLQAADILSKINVAQEEQRQQLALVSSQQLQGVL